MMKPKIFVTGATGKTGSNVVSQLLEKGYSVRAFVRKEDAASANLKKQGAEIATGDLFDPEDLLSAMQGTQRAYYCPPFHPSMIHSAVAFAVAAKQANLEHIVGLTQWLASPSHPSISSRHHWLSDQLFSMLPGISHTIVNPGLFAEYPYMALLKYAAHLGVFPMPGDAKSKNAPPSNHDIAAVAVGALIDPEKHSGKSYRPTGPEMLSIEEMVEIMGHVLNRKVRLVKMPMWMFFKAARHDGTSEILMNGLQYYVQEHSAGAFAFGGTTDDVFEVTGKRPEDFATIARRHALRADILPTFANKLKTFMGFMMVPMSGGFNYQAYEREMDFPLPSHPKLDMQNEVWKKEHAEQVTRGGIKLAK